MTGAEAISTVGNVDDDDSGCDDEEDDGAGNDASGCEAADAACLDVGWATSGPER